MSKAKGGSAATRRGERVAEAIHCSNIFANETRRRVWVFSLRAPANGAPRGSRAVPARETRCARCHVPMVSSLRVTPRGGGLCRRGARRRTSRDVSARESKTKTCRRCVTIAFGARSTRGGGTHRLKHAASLSLFQGQLPFQLGLLLHELLPQTQELLLLRGGALLRPLRVGARHLGTRNAPAPRKRRNESPATGGRFSRYRRPSPAAQPRSAS